MRRAAAEMAVTDMINWFHDDKSKGVVAILDATNSTKERRKWIYEKCRDADIETLFVESICDDEELIMNNILEVKTDSPDYQGQDPELAALDFRKRILNYEKAYETIDDNEKHYTYVKLINVGSTVIINQIKDYLSSRLVYYIQNLHIKPRSIWLSRVSKLHRSQLSLLRQNADFSSTVNPSITLLARSVVTPTFPSEAKPMLALFQISSGNPAYHQIPRLSFGHQPYDAQSKPPAISKQRPASRNSSGKPWMNWTLVSVTASHTNKLQRNIQMTSKPEMMINTTTAIVVVSPIGTL